MQHLALSLSLQVLSQPHQHCKSSAAHLLSSSRSQDYWWLKGRGREGNRNDRSISVNTVYNLPQNIALAGLPFFFCISWPVVSLREFIDMQTDPAQIAVLLEWWAEEFSQDWSHRTLYRLLGKRERGGIDWDAAGAVGLVIILIHWKRQTVWQSLFL